MHVHVSVLQVPPKMLRGLPKQNFVQKKGCRTIWAFDGMYETSTMIFKTDNILSSVATWQQTADNKVSST
jgi:hypothetical protein